MNWYLAKIIYSITCGNGHHTAQFDEQLRLITAENKSQAFQKAVKTGIAEEDIFLNNKQQLVRWRFINVTELYKLDKLIDGAELYSRIEEKEDPEKYLQYLNKKSEQLQFSNTAEMLQLA